MNQINIFFWSKRCNGSITLKKLMENEGIIGYFYVFSVDPEDNIGRNITIPRNIVTPTIMVKGNPTPYSGQEAFLWLARIKHWKATVTMKNINNAQNEHMSSILNNLTNENDNVIGYSKSEMGNTSDTFSFYSNDINKECQDAMPQSFFSVNNIGKENIFTPPLENGSYRVNPNNKCSLSESETSKRMEQYDKQRKEQDMLVKKSIETFRNQAYQG